MLRRSACGMKRSVFESDCASAPETQSPTHIANARAKSRPICAKIGRAKIAIMCSPASFLCN
jgi:hypothetical protein